MPPIALPSETLRAASSPDGRRSRPVSRPAGDRAPAASPAAPGTACAAPNHHLWKNGRFWWVAFTVIENGYRQHRIRRSLRTDDVDLARQRRDRLMTYHDARPGHEVACLRRMRQEATDPRTR